MRAWLQMWRLAICYKGCADRPCYWKALGMNIAVMYILLVPVALIFGRWMNLPVNAVMVVYLAAMNLPVPALYIRRARDSGWRMMDAVMLAVFCPVVSIVLMGVMPVGAHKKPRFRFGWYLLGVGTAMFLYGGVLSAWMNWKGAVSSLPAGGLLTIVASFILIALIEPKLQPKIKLEPEIQPELEIQPEPDPRPESEPQPEPEPQVRYVGGVFTMQTSERFGAQRRDLLLEPYVEHLDSEGNRCIYRLYSLPPDGPWEISQVGLDIRTGEPWLEESRQRSYGPVLGGESEWTKLTYDQVRNLTGKSSTHFREDFADLSEETWRNYIPKDVLASAQRKPVAISVGQDQLAKDTELGLDAIFVRVKLRFGENFCFLRRCDSGYRALWGQTCIAGRHIYVSIQECPSEQMIAEWMNGTEYIGNVDLSDRLLTDTDLRCIAHRIRKSKLFEGPQYQEAVVPISIYGNDWVTARYWKDGQCIGCAGKAAYQVADAIRDVVRGIQIVE